MKHLPTTDAALPSLSSRSATTAGPALDLSYAEAAEVIGVPIGPGMSTPPCMAAPPRNGSERTPKPLVSDTALLTGLAEGMETIAC